EDMERIIENDPNVRFVLKEFPVLGSDSVDAAQVSLAMSVLSPENYGQFHIDLLGMSGVKNGERAFSLAERMGVDREALEAEIEKPYIIETLTEVYQLAEALGINGTPSYVVGESVVFGAVGYDQLKNEVASQLEQ
ncbi:MAG: DsbA family protein, partial [Pseudomonadota bacterium]